jgi:hypothetical protein
LLNLPLINGLNMLHGGVSPGHYSYRPGAVAVLL